jgi:hypothetical protein
MSTIRTFKQFTVINETYFAPGAPTDQAWHVARSCEFGPCGKVSCNCTKIWVVFAPDRLPEDASPYLWDALRLCRRYAAEAGC